MSEPTFQQLSEQVQRLTMRVTALERELGMRRGSVEEQTSAAKPAEEIVKQPVAEHAVPGFALTPEAAPRLELQAGTHLESSVGLQLVNRVGAITLILGIAFFFRYAVEKNWIGETVRVLLGICAGTLMLGGGEFAFRRGQRVFAQGITGAGIAIVYLAVYAAFGVYGLVAWPVGWLGIAAVTALAAYLATRYDSQAIAGLALFGGFLAPLLFERVKLNPWLVPVYVGFLVAGFLTLAQRHRWIWCAWLALAGTFLFTVNFSGPPLYVMLGSYYLLFALQPNRRLFGVAHVLFLGRATFVSEGFPVYAVELAGMSAGGVAVVRWRGWFQYASLLTGTAGVSWFLANAFGSRSSERAEMGVLSILFMLFVAASYSRVKQRMVYQELLAIPISAAAYFIAMYGVLFRAGHGPAPLSGALLALSLGAIYFAMAYRFRAVQVVSVLSGGIAIAFLTIAIPIGFSSFRITAAWALEGAALVWIGAKRGISLAENLGFVVLVIAMLHFYFFGLGSGNGRFVTAAGLAAALFLMAAWMKDIAVPRTAPGVAGHVLLLTATGLEIADWATRNHPANLANIANAGISIAFAAYAVGLVALGTGTRTVANRYLGLLLIALVVVKLYLYDVWNLDVIYRFIAFAALGALLLTMSFLYSRYRERIAGWLKADDATQPGASATHPQQQQE